MVEQPRPGLRQQRGLAPGLPPGHASAGCAREDRGDLQDAEVQRPRAAGHRLRLHAVAVGSAAGRIGRIGRIGCMPVRATTRFRAWTRASRGRHS
jgi:hypothetical protein